MSAHGDAVLRADGESLLEGLRGDDITARLGGEGSIVVLVHLNDAVVVRDALLRLLERLRRASGCAATQGLAGCGEIHGSERGAAVGSAQVAYWTDVCKNLQQINALQRLIGFLHLR